MYRWLVCVLVLVMASPVMACGGFGGWGGGGCGSFGGWGGYSGFAGGWSYGSGCGAWSYDSCGNHYIVDAGCGTAIGGCDSGCSPVVTYSTQSVAGCELPADYYEPAKTASPTPAPEKAALPLEKEELTPTPETRLPAAPSGPGPFEPTSFRRTVQMPVKTGDAQIILHVPSSAKVWINDILTKKEGTERKYVSVGLQPGLHYKYRIAVEVGGKVARQEVVMTAGGKRTLRYR